MYSDLDLSCPSVYGGQVAIEEVWKGIPLTYDAFQVTTTPNCNNLLGSLGPGYTGSSTFTSVPYSKGLIGFGKNNFGLEGPGVHPFDGKDFLTIDGTTVGCWTSLYYLAQSCTVFIINGSCNTAESGWNILTYFLDLETPVTDYGQETLQITENGQFSFAPQLASQLSTLTDAAAIITSANAVASTIVARPSPSSVLVPLDTSNTELPWSTKITLVAAVAFAIVLICSFIAFFIWKRFCKSGSPKVVRLSSTSKPMVAQRKKSWRAPLVMLAGFISGLVFALVHHFFYNWVNGHRVEDISISQSWILRLGNLFAFAVKLSLAISIGVAFVQLQWAKFRQQSLKLRLKDIDALSGILANVLNFGDSLLWLRFPSLLVIALLYWILPIIPVLTPGTIVVASVPYRNLSQLAVPQFEFNSNWNSPLIADSSGISTQGSSSGMSTRGSLALSKIVTASAVLGEILPIQFNHTNATYHLDFFSPALQCSRANDSLTLWISKLMSERAEAARLNDAPAIPFFSWAQNTNITDISDISCGSDEDNLDTASPDRARVFIMTDNGYGSPIPGAQIPGNLIFGTNNSVFATNVTECSLYNATYSVDFIWENAEQRVVVQNITYIHGVSFFDNVLDDDPDTTYADTTNAYAGLMTAFGSLLVGSFEVGKFGIVRRCTSVDYLDTGMNFELGDVGSLESFQKSIEKVFQNVTISLMSNGAFLKNPSTADLIDVNITTYQNTYSYNSFDLVLTYAIGMLITLICCLIGFHVFEYSDGSYQNIFSTFIRATNYSELDIENEDTGADPCPRALRKIPVTFTTDKIRNTRSPSEPAKQHLIPRKPV